MNNLYIFAAIAHSDEDGEKFWYASELQNFFEYESWQEFQSVIEKAKSVHENSLQFITSTPSFIEFSEDFIAIDHFAEVGKIVKAGATSKEITDYKLTRYACYLIAQNADPGKKPVAYMQTYISIQTRRAEISYDQIKRKQKKLE